MGNILTTLATSYYSSGDDDLSELIGIASRSSGAGQIEAMGVWTLVSLILAVIGGILAYFLFVKKKNLNIKNKFLAWLKKFLAFDTMMIEDILKTFYIIIAIFITLSSFSMISVHFLAFLMYLVLGNVITRIIYELIMINIMIWRNTTEIKNNTNKEVKTEKK